MSNEIEEKINEILDSNDRKDSVKALAMIMRNIAKNDITIADAPDHTVKYEIDSVCEMLFG
jgi:hypothetical protein